MREGDNVDDRRIYCIIGQVPLLKASINIIVYRSVTAAQSYIFSDWNQQSL
jgi:hypothetical protein